MTGDEAKEILNEDSPYTVLGINSRATKAEIRKAFYACAMKYHPDKNPDHVEWANEMMKKINAAYTLLK